MIRRKQKREEVSDNAVVKESSHRVCLDLRRRFEGPCSPSKITIQCKRLSALLVGTLQDVFQCREHWDSVDFFASSPISARLIHVLSRRISVKSIILREACQSVLEQLANWIGNDKMASIDNLSIRGTTISLPSAICLAKGLASTTTVSGLELSQVSILSDEIAPILAEAISRNRRLKRLSLQACYLEDQEIAGMVGALESNDGLEELNLSINFCQENCSQVLSKMLLSSGSHHLRVLDLSGQETWDDRSYYVHYAHALSNPQCPLKELNLSSNFLGDKQFVQIIEALQTNNQIQIINLRGNQISNAGIEALACAMPKLKLKKFILDDNAYGTLSLRLLQECMKHQTTLCDLVLDFRDDFPLISYYLALNRAGRYCKFIEANVPLGLWAYILARCHGQVSSHDDRETSVTEADLLFDLLHGPAMMER